MKTQLGRILWRYQRPFFHHLCRPYRIAIGNSAQQPLSACYAHSYRARRTVAIAETVTPTSRPIKKDDPQPINLQQDDTLRTTTEKWLKETDNDVVWTASHVAMARNLLSRWLTSKITKKKQEGDDENDEQAARFVALILRQWLHRTSSARSSVNNKELNEYFHRVLWRQSSPDQAVKLFQEFNATKEPFLQPGPRAYSMVFEKLLKQADQPETLVKAEKIMEEFFEQTFPREIEADALVALNSFLNILAEASKHDEEAPIKARDYLMSCRRLDVRSYAAVLKAFANSSRKDAGKRSYKLLERMLHQRKVPYNRVCFNLCLQALGKAGEGDNAKELLWRMHRFYTLDGYEEARPDHYSFLAAINAYAKGDEPEKAQGLLETMATIKDTFSEYAKSDSLRPTTEIYNAVLDGWARQQNCGEKVEKLLGHMENLYRDGDEHVRPSLESYTLAIRAWGNKSKDAPDVAERITDIVRRMDTLAKAGRRDLEPNTITYATLIHAWAQSSDNKNSPDNALTVLRHMEKLQRESAKSPVAPNIVVFNSVLHAFVRKGRLDEARALLEEMKSRSSLGGNTSNPSVNFRPDAISWGTMIAGYRHSKDPDAGKHVDELLTELETLYGSSGDASLKPTDRIYASVIFTHGLHGSAADAEAAFFRMVDRFQDSSVHGAQPPTTFVCNALLKVWSQSDDPVAPQRAETIFRWMERQIEEGGDMAQDLRPDVMTCNLLVSIWEQSERRNASSHIQRLQENLVEKYPDLLKQARKLKKDGKTLSFDI